MQDINWLKDFNIQSEKYHRIAVWLVIVLYLAFSVADYFAFPEHWKTFFFIRLATSIISLTVILTYKKLSLSPSQLLLIPFVCIITGVTYMYSVMNLAQFQQQTFLYVIIFIGAGMLALWKPIYSIAVIVLNLIANLIMFPLFSSLSLEEVLFNGGLLIFTVSIFMAILIHTRYTLTIKEIKSRLTLEESNQELEKQKEIVEKAHNELKSSINYAERIQSALLERDDSWNNIGQERFILFKPRDIVSGDFYWSHTNERFSIWASADSTGHGVPGAFMSMLGVSLLNNIVVEKEIYNPSEVLNVLRQEIILALQKKGEERNDGMDIAFCVLNKENNTLSYAGAYNPLIIIRNNELIEYKADKMPIGKFKNDNIPFITHEIEVKENDNIYTFSDGFQDQFGGPRGKKYMIKRMKKLILSISSKPMNEQHGLLNKAFNNWMKEGYTDQVDDVCIIGVRV